MHGGGGGDVYILLIDTCPSIGWNVLFRSLVTARVEGSEAFRSILFASKDEVPVWLASYLADSIRYKD